MKQTGNLSFNKAVRKILYYLPYVLYARPRTMRTDEVTIFGFNLTVPPTVFHPSLFFSSKFLSSHLRSLDLAGARVLDLGCGSGLLSIVAASLGASVTAVDINERAVEASRINAGRNGLTDRITVSQSNLFDGISGRELFNLIVVNPPFHVGLPRNVAEMAWKGGDDREYFHRLADGAAHFLAPGGTLIYVISSDSPTGEIEGILTGKGFSVRQVCRRKYIFESLSIHEVSRRS